MQTKIKYGPLYYRRPTKVWTDLTNEEKIMQAEKNKNKKKNARKSINRKAKGNRRELQIRNILLKYFPYVSKSGGSLGAFDLIATDWSNLHLYVQVKSNDHPKYLSTEDNLLTEMGRLSSRAHTLIVSIAVKDGFGKILERSNVLIYSSEGNTTTMTMVAFLAMLKLNYGISTGRCKRMKVALELIPSNDKGIV